MSDARFTGKLVVVTGAGSGIGRATALAFAGEGAHLALCDIDEATLEETAAAARALGRRVITRRVDVASRGDVAAFADDVHREHEAADVVVNNAGVAVSGGFVETTLEDWAWVMGINVMGVVHGGHFFVPRMIQRGQGGHVVNIASAAGLGATAPLVAYSTTKFAVVGMSEAMRADLKRHRIGVTAICPGFVRTGIGAASRGRGVWGTDEGKARTKKLIDRGIAPERVAARILDAVTQNEPLAIVGTEAVLMHTLKRLSPGLFEAVTHRVLSLAQPRG
jgi:NAD(P)-dependent dehydrogenase (short-subunit alcohol dehydrogenase family)